MRLIASLALILCLSAPALSANPRRTRPATNPSTAPATLPSAELQQQIDQLIQKLGDPEFRTRESASAELRRIGEPAIAQLQQATKNTDAEIAGRAQYLLDEINEAKGAKVAANNPNQPRVIQLGNGQAHIVIHVNGGQVATMKQVTDRTIEENGRKIRLQENDKGITLTVTEQKDGKPTTQEYKAASAEELKKNNPDAYKLYEKFNTKVQQQQIELKIGQ